MKITEFTLKHMVVFFSAVVLLTGCMVDGKPGDVFLTLEPSTKQFVTFYWDDNPSIPEAFRWGFEYPSYPGVFNYEYGLGDGFAYWGTYTLLAAPGRPSHYGGHDGPHRHYTFYLYGESGFTDYYEHSVRAPELQADPNELRASAEILPDTVIRFDSFEMHLTRNRMPVKFFKGNQPKKGSFPDQ